jgi:hypothetical protein
MPSLSKYDPLDRPATVAEIKDIHRRLETSPVMVRGFSLDCDEKSEIRMRDALAYWDSRPLEPGVFEEALIDGAPRRFIYWTLGDNSIGTFYKEELESLYSDMLLERAKRGAILFGSFRRFKTEGANLRALQDPEFWGL